MSERRLPEPRHDAKQRGLTLVEVSIASVILTLALVSVASSFGSNATAVENARGVTRASQFLEEVLDSVTAQPFDNLTSLNGNRLYDHTTHGEARYRAEITVSLAAVDLYMVRVKLLANKSGNEITKVVTYRSRR